MYTAQNNAAGFVWRETYRTSRRTIYQRDTPRIYPTYESPYPVSNATASEYLNPDCPERSTGTRRRIYERHLSTIRTTITAVQIVLF